MPELPEVQTVINNLLNKGILNKKITNIDIIDSIVLKNSTNKEFCDFMVSESILDIKRIGKYLVFLLSNKKTFVAHLRMEGKFYFDKVKNQREKKFLIARIVFNQESLDFFDFRKFGTFTIYNKNNFNEIEELKKIAIDPLSKNFSGEFLFQKSRKLKKVIKTALLDQKFVSGIGNVYADEILFASKIHPETRANLLTIEQYNEIAKHSIEILKEAISMRGTTIYSYKFDKNDTGGFQKKLRVYGRQTQPCIRCEGIIKKIKVNGRGTHFCESCQQKGTKC